MAEPVLTSFPVHVLYPILPAHVKDWIVSRSYTAILCVQLLTLYVLFQFCGFLVWATYHGSSRACKTSHCESLSAS